MKFTSIKKVHAGKFIHRYDITYEKQDGTEKIYEMISRNPEVTTLSDLQEVKVDSVVMMMHDEKGEKILLNKELRLALGKYVYNFPAGLIEPGETVKEAAKRELWEETGLTLQKVCDVLPVSYGAVGFSNEMNVCLVGVATGVIKKSTSEVEQIYAAWYTKEEVRELLQTEMFAGRTQSYCYLWSMEVSGQEKCLTER